MTHQEFKRESIEDVEMRDETQEEQFKGLFKMPEIIKSFDSYENNTGYHDELK